MDKHAVEGEQSIKLCNYLDVYKNERITPNMDFMLATASAEQIKRLSIQRDDVLMTKDSETPDDIGVPALVADDIEGVVCGYHLALLRPRPELCVGAYLARLLTSTYIQAQFATSAVGLTRYGLGKYDIENVLLPIPSTYEQTAIATFLDRQTTKFDTLIAKQEKLIELLQEKRQALISHAVTKGLIPDVPMKDSGVEWLGEVPEHWEVGPLKRFANVIDCKHHTVQFYDDGLPIVSIREIREDRIELAGAKLTSLDEWNFLREGRVPHRGDMIFCRNASVGAVGYVDFDEPFCMGQDVCLLRSYSKSRFMHYQLISPLIRNQIEAFLVGATIRRVNVEEIRGLFVTYPPDQEQEKIAVFLLDETTKLDTLIAKSRRSIDLLREHRTALISAAVTGKIDVREAA